MTDNRTTELLPCPFCGGGASIYEEIPGGYIVQCHDCCGQIGIMTREHAIAAWNARAERTCRSKPHLNLTVGDDFLTQSGWSCSECGGRLDLPVKAYYCPNCGAKVIV